MATNKENVQNIALPAMDLGYFMVKIVGDSPLIVHKWTVKAKQEILDKQMKKAANGKEAKNPVQDYLNSLYWLDDTGASIETPAELADATPETPFEDIQKVLEKGRFGFPACAFKACALDAGYQQGVITKKTTSRGAFHILGEYAVIEGSLPQMREDMVTVGGMTKVPDIRYRPEFPTWQTTLNIRYNKKAISKEQIINLLNYGGFCNGVGEWRPSRDGSFGTFHCG